MTGSGWSRLLYFLLLTIAFHHLKIESIIHILHIIRPNAYMESIKLKDKFSYKTMYSKQQSYLKYLFFPKYTKYMSNGYIPVMCIFTNITKAPFSDNFQMIHIWKKVFMNYVFKILKAP